MRLAIIAVLASGALTPPALAAEVSVATCDADIAAVGASFDETQARLDKAAGADQAEQCAAIRHHVEVMANGVNVFQRCLPDDHDKGENMAQLVGSIADFLDVSDSLGCPAFDPPKIDGME
jgi:hypothetical protein